MNQEQVKNKLLQIDNSVEDFTVIFSGKTSKKVNGLYHPDKQEIIIHNRNFTDDNPLMYTAIHEFAHHIQHTRSSLPISTRAHTNRFWNILHRLLFDAEENGIYINIFKSNQKFIALTRKIRDNFLSVNGDLMKEFGRLLLEAFTLCMDNNVSFDDYMDRELLLHRSTAKTLMKVYSMDISPEIGFENMKTVAGIRDVEARKEAEEAFLTGRSPDMVKAEFTARKMSKDALQDLIQERDRIENTIGNLTVKLAKIERRIDDLKFE